MIKEYKTIVVSPDHNLITLDIELEDGWVIEHSVYINAAFGTSEIVYTLSKEKTKNEKDVKYTERLVEPYPILGNYAIKSKAVTKDCDGKILQEETKYYDEKQQCIKTHIVEYVY